MKEPSQTPLPWLPPHLARTERATITASVNATLLRCHAMLQLPPGLVTPDRTLRDIHFLALGHADDALATALASHAHQARARAYLFRGHCLVRLGEWERAHAAYVRAASVRGPWWGDTDIEALTGGCLRAMGCMPKEVGQRGCRDMGSGREENVRRN